MSLPLRAEQSRAEQQCLARSHARPAAPGCNYPRWGRANAAWRACGEPVSPTTPVGGLHGCACPARASACAWVKKKKKRCCVDIPVARPRTFPSADTNLDWFQIRKWIENSWYTQCEVCHKHTVSHHKHITGAVGDFQTDVSHAQHHEETL